MEVDIFECCDICGEGHDTVRCPELGLSATTAFTQPATRARLTLPPNFEVVDNSQGGTQVVAKETIEKRKQLGPFEAKRTTHIFDDTGFFTLKLLGKDGNMVVLDTTDENDCNWMCLVRSALSEDSQNCMAYQLGTDIYYNTTRQINVGEELQVWYAPHFAKKLRKPTEPDPNYKVLLGHRIEPLPLDEPQEDDISLDGVENSLGQAPPTSMQAPTGELVRVHKCPRCPKEFKTQTDMVQHLREHVLPTPYKDKISQTPKMRGRPRIHPIKEQEESNTPKRKRGRPRKNGTESNEGVNIAGFDDNNSAGDDDSSSTEESDDIGEKRLRIVEFDILDKDYSPLRQVDMSKRRVQPRRSLKGQHSKYGNDFVVGKLGKRADIKKERDNELNEEKRSEKDSEKEVQGKTSQQIPSGRKRGRPRKVLLKRTEEESKGGFEHESDNELSFSVKLPVKTYEKKSNIKNSNENTDDKLSNDEKISTEKSGRSKERLVSLVVKNENEIEMQLVMDKDTEVANGTDDVLTDVTGENDEGLNNSNESEDEKKQIIIISSKSRDSLQKSSVKMDSPDDFMNEIFIDATVIDDNRNDSSQVMLNESDREDTVEKESIQGDNIAEEGVADNTSIEDEVSELMKDRNGMASDSINETQDLPKSEGSINEKEMNTTDAVEGSHDATEKFDGENKKRFNQDIIRTNIIKVEDNDGNLYKCGICEKVFAKLNYLKSHIPKHTEKFKCDLCGKMFTNPDSLQKHQCTVSKTLLDKPVEEIVTRVEVDGQDEYHCAICQENFSTQIDAIAHYMTHSDDNLTCLKCNKVLETLEDHKCDGELHKSHRNSSSEQALEFPCDLCSQSFRNAKYLHRHLVMHTDMFKCEKCNFCFSRKDSLQKHVLKCCPELASSYNIQYCGLCYRVFSTKSGKINHAAKCKWVKCEDCSRVFSSSKDMESHDCFTEENVVESSGIEFSCGKCGKSFLSHYYLMQHQAIHEETFQCSICKKNLKSQEDLTNHTTICQLVQKIRISGAAACDVCAEIFTKSKDLRLHYHTHTHPYFCNNCEKRFLKEAGLLGHNCTSVEPTFNCKVCNKYFTSQRFLARHTAVTHSRQTYECGHCGKGFSRRLKYQNHVCKLGDGSYGKVTVKKGTRSVIEKLICDTCGKTFSSRSNLNKHVISHGEKQCRCKHCGKMFHYETYLREHISSVHLKIFNYMCTECGKLMKSKAGLTSHVKQFHRENSESFTCEVCGKCFKQKGNLNTHMYSHQTDRSFVCEFCQKTFKYPDQLSRHKLFHTMQNKLQCSYCEKYFVKEYELRRHEMVFHSGLVYVCAVCSARCGHKHTLIRHFKRKHPGNVENLVMAGYIDAMLKRIEELPNTGKVETLECEVEEYKQEIEPQLITEIDLMNGPVMPPQDAAEVLHSLSNSAAIIEPHSENRKPKGEQEESGEGNQTNSIQIQLQPINEIQQGEVIQQGNVLPEQIVRIESTEVKMAHDENESTITQDDKPAEEIVPLNTNMISINGQLIPLTNLQTIQQATDSGEAAEGQILILQIWDPQGAELGSQEQFIQIQTPAAVTGEETNKGHKLEPHEQLIQIQTPAAVTEEETNKGHKLGPHEQLIQIQQEQLIQIQAPAEVTGAESNEGHKVGPQ